MARKKEKITADYHERIIKSGGGTTIPPEIIPFEHDINLDQSDNQASSNNDANNLQQAFKDAMINNMDFSKIYTEQAEARNRSNNLFNKIASLDNQIQKTVENFTGKTLYGIDVNERRYLLKPKFCNPLDKRNNKLVFRSEIGPQYFSAGTYQFEKIFNPPKDGYYQTIPEMMMVFFSSEVEIDRTIKEFGQIKDFIYKVLSRTIEYKNGVSKNYTVISKDPYYTISDNGVEKRTVPMPQMDESERQKLIDKGILDTYRMQTEDVIIVKTSLSSGLKSDKNSTQDFSQQRIYYVDRSNIKAADPINIGDNSIVMFKSEIAAMQFLLEFKGSYFEYLFKKVEEASEQRHRSEKRKLYERLKKNKNSVIVNMAIVAGSTVLGIILDKLITIFLKKEGQ